MEISKQVISLELAKKLKEAGVKQESYFFWQGTELTDNPVTESRVTEMGMCGLCGDSLPSYGMKCECSCSKWSALSNYSLWGWVEFKDNHHETYSAFSVAELGEMLPAKLYHQEHTYTLTIEKIDSGFRVFYLWETDALKDIQFESENMSECLGSMLLHLLTNNLISLDDVNKMK